MNSCYTFNPKHLPGKVWKGLTTNHRKLHPTKSPRLVHLVAARISLWRPRRHSHHASARSFESVYVDKLIFSNELQVVEGSALVSSAGKEEKRKTPAGGDGGTWPSVTSASGAVMMFIAEFRKETS